MTQITQRQKTIRRIDLLSSSIPYQGGDWKDDIAAFSSKLPPQHELIGITKEEYSVLSSGDSCPRTCSSLLGDLTEEIEGIVFHDEYEVGQIMKSIKELRRILTSLEKSLYLL